MIAAFVTMSAREGEYENLVNELKKLVVAAVDEQGNLVYAIHTSEREPDVVRVYEVYADKEAFNLHANSQAMNEFVGKTEKLLVKPMEIVRCDVAEAKGLPGQG